MTFRVPQLRRLLKRLSFAAALAFVLPLASPFAPSLVAPWAAAEENTPGQTFRTIIQNQMQAFRRGDAPSAFGFATKSLQQRFQTPDIFIEMVKQGYAPVYRPQSVTFGKIKETDYGPVQEVYVTDPDGENWLALYSFEQQEDGSWRISGCYLTKSPGLSA